MKIIITALLLMAVHFAVQAQNIVRGEYFIDVDKGFGGNTVFAVTPSPDGSFPFTASLSNVAAGYHNLFIRTKDANGNWSLTARKSIEVLATAQNKIVTGEYFFDTDPGFNNASAINITTQDSLIMQNFTASLNMLDAGYHKMFLRLKDANGNWGITSRYNVEVVEDITGGKVFMVEYFFDKDPGFGNCASAVFAKASADGSFTFTIPQSNIPDNPGTLYMRVKDSGNYNWSLTTWQSYSALPLTILSFTAQKQNSNALLHWQTSNEVNTGYFNIQRSVNNLNFSNIGKVFAKNKNTVVNNYDFTDDLSNLPSGNIFYRLQTADKDGKIAYSKTVSLGIDNNSIQFTIKPNPASNYCYINNVGNINWQNAIIEVSNLFGHTLFTQKISSNNNYMLNLSSLSKGIFLIRLSADDFTATQKLIIQ